MTALDVTLRLVNTRAAIDAAPSALQFEVSVAKHKVEATRYQIRKSYKDLIRLQADLVRENLTEPVLLAISVTATAEARKSSAEALLRRFDRLETLPERARC